MSDHNIETATGTANDVFVGRQPILNNGQRIFGYELLFRSPGGDINSVPPMEATGRVLINAFNNIGLERVLEGRRAFINVSEEMLQSDILEVLPKEKIVIELLETIPPTSAVVERVRALRAAGYQFALDDFVYRPEYEPLIDLVNYIKFDVLALGIEQTIKQLDALRGRGLSFIAEKVETRAEFDACRAARFNYYQGYYFARPETVSVKRADPRTTRLIRIFNLVRQDAEEDIIAAEFKQDVALSYNLLRFVNSAAMGLRNKIDSIGRALTVLGRTRLARWISLLMLAPGDAAAPNALFKTALIRARSAELLAPRNGNAQLRDSLFVTGMFSLLDVALGIPLTELLRDMQLPDDVRDALLKECGPLAPYLKLVRAVEVMDVEAIMSLALVLGLTIDQISAAHLEALTWAEGMDGA
jgi:EAL and modified HD-GYP domain-containing signal transduction protein